MPGPVIRTIDRADLPRLLEINEANVPEVGAVDAGRLAFITAESAIALVTTVDDELAGFCLVLRPGSGYDSANYRWFMDRYDDAMYLDRVAFDDRFRGRGLGTALYAAVEQRMRDDHPDIGRLTLEVNVDPPNEPSLAFHAKLGFVEIGRQPYHGQEVSLMHKPLR